MINMEDIWQGWSVTQVGKQEIGGEKKRARDRRLQQRRDQIHALEIVNDVEPGLLAGVAESSLNTKQVEDIFERVIQDFSGHRLKKIHNFLVKGFSSGVEQELWKIPVPVPMVNVRCDSSPYRPSRFHLLPSLNMLYGKFESSLEENSFFELSSNYTRRVKIKKESPPVTTQQLQAGQIIFSAIVNGAILNGKWLACFGDAFSKRLVVDGNLLWLDLVDPGKNDSDVELLRRWFPDPLTALLILRWRKQHGTKWVPDESGRGALRQNDFLLNRYLASLSIRAANRPSVYQLMKMADTRLSIQLPPYLTEYAKNRRDAPSLPANSWFRFRSNRRFDPPAALDKTESTLILPRRRSKLLNRTKFPDQIKKYKQILKYFSSYHYKRAPQVSMVTKAVDELLENDDGISPLLEALTQWSLEMMRSDRVTGTKLKPSSAREYLSSIASFLIKNAAELDVCKLGRDDWINLYDKVIEGAKSPGSRNFKIGRLSTFHSFLVANYHVPMVELEIVQGSTNRVDSNILNQSEYGDILNRIWHNSALSERHRRMLRIFVILGFRCGFRSSEVLTRQLIDLQGLAPKHEVRQRPHLSQELLLRNNYYGTLKSDKSTRRIPLYALLTEDELSEIYAWKQLRMRELSGENIRKQLLFCRPGEDSELITEYEGFSLIHQTIRDVTADYTMHFHHLRHSYSNRLFLKLIDDDVPGIESIEWGYSNRPENSPRSALLAQTESQPTKKCLYAIAKSLGHVDPNETINSYFHLFDFTLGHTLKNLSPKLSSLAQANLLGVSFASLKAYRSKYKLKGEVTATQLLSTQLRRYENKLLDPLYQVSKSVESLSISQEVPPSYVDYLPSASLLYAMFKQRYQGMTISNISQTYGYTPADIGKWIERAKCLAKINTGRDCSRNIPTPDDMYEFNEMPVGAILPGYCPAIPHSMQNRSLANEVSSNLFNLYQKNPDWVEAGLSLYLTHTTTSHTSVKFHRNDDVKSYVKFLRKSGVATERIQVLIYRSDVSKTPSKYWMKHLQVPLENVRYHEPIKNNETVRASVFISGVSNRVKNKVPRVDRKGVGFAFYMAAILLDIDINSVSKSGLNNQPSLFGFEQG